MKMQIKTILIIYLLSIYSCNAQTVVDDCLGGWSGIFEDKNPFLFEIKITTKNKKTVAIFKGRKSTTEIHLEAENDRYLFGEVVNQLSIRIDTTYTEPIAFIKTGHHLSNLELKRNPQGDWVGKWNLLIGESVLPSLYLAIDKSDEGVYSATPFFKEPTLHYMLGQGLKTQRNEIHFTDIRSNINFSGLLQKKLIKLKLQFLNEYTTIQLSPLPYDQWEIGLVEAQKKTEPKDTRFSKLIADVKNDTLERTHSVVISQFGEIILEEYFDGFTSTTPHDTRSLSKSIASAMIGIAIADQKIDNEYLPIKNFYEDDYPEITWEDGKKDITIHHLMTMSSGLDAIDFGLNRNSFANEYTYQSQEDWTAYILKAPMVFKSGEKANYGSGSTHLLAPIVSKSISERLEFYIHRKLFKPLSIENYRIQTDHSGNPYFGGGWYLTPLDLQKFGQLYLNKGMWNGKEIIARQWVKKSMKKLDVLENTRDKNEYGYLFWHKTYEVKGKKIASVEARGTGGQYLFIIPEHELIVVITSGNYSNNKGFQPEKIMEEYILTEIID